MIVVPTKSPFGPCRPGSAAASPRGCANFRLSNEGCVIVRCVSTTLASGVRQGDPGVAFFVYPTAASEADWARRFLDCFCMGIREVSASEGWIMCILFTEMKYLS